MLPALTEDAFKTQVMQFARVCGWKVAHFRPLRTGKGKWRTPVQGDGKGFPDLVLVKLRGRRRTIYAELKSEDGESDPAQREWQEALIAAGEEVYEWRPSDWPAVQATLTA